LDTKAFPYTTVPFDGLTMALRPFLGWRGVSSNDKGSNISHVV
jgi:hypothetical protein